MIIKSAFKRMQSQACLGYAEREQILQSEYNYLRNMNKIKKIMRTRLMILAAALMIACIAKGQENNDRPNGEFPGGPVGNFQVGQGGFPGGPGGFPGGFPGGPGGPGGFPFMMDVDFDAIKEYGVEIDKRKLDEGNEQIVTDKRDSTSVYFVENETFEHKVTIRFDGNVVNVEGLPSGVKSETVGADLKLTVKGMKICYELSGKSEDGSVHIKSDRPTKLILNGLDLKSESGEAISVTGKESVYLVLSPGSTNRLEDKFRDVEERSSFGVPSPFQRRDDLAEEDLEEVGGVKMKKALNRSKKLSESKVSGVLTSSGLLSLSGDGELTVVGHNKSGLKSKGHMIFRPGIVTNIEVSQGKGLSSKGDIRIYGGVVNIDGSSSGEDGIRSECSIYISGGRTTVLASGGEGSEGIEGKYNIIVNGGVVEVASFDDGLNAGGNLIVNGGKVFVASVFNDALDSNCNLVINGGEVTAFGGGVPECGLDANEEEGYELYINGGHVVSVGGRSTPTSVQSRQQSLIYSCESIDSGSVYGVYDNELELMRVKIVRKYDREGSFLFSCPEMKKGINNLHVEKL